MFVTTISEGASVLLLSDEHGAELVADAASFAGYECIDSDGVLVRQPGADVGREFSWNGLTITVTVSLPTEVVKSRYSVKPTSVSVLGSVTLDGVSYDLDSVLGKASYRCTAITSADPPGIDRVGNSVFYGCKNSSR